MARQVGSRILAALLAGCLVGCQEAAEAPVLPEETPIKDARILGEFIGSFNADTGALTFAPATAIGSMKQNMDDVVVVQDGKTGTGPDDTVELVTDPASVVQTATGCGGPALEAKVTLRSFYPGSLGNVYMQILSINGGAFELCNSDSAAGLSSQFGLIHYGDGLLNGKNSSVERLWKFNLPATTNFTFKARIVSSWCGQAACIGWCNVQWFSSPTAAGQPTNAYGRVYVQDRTNVWGACHPSIESQFGYGPDNSDPRKDSGWTWTNGSPNGGPDWCSGDGVKDEHQATFTPAAGTYRATWRFRLNDVPNSAWVYCDSFNCTQEPCPGAGWNSDVFFSPSDLPTIQVN